MKKRLEPCEASCSRRAVSSMKPTNVMCMSLAEGHGVLCGFGWWYDRRDGYSSILCCCDGYVRGRCWAWPPGALRASTLQKMVRSCIHVAPRQMRIRQQLVCPSRTSRIVMDALENTETIVFSVRLLVEDCGPILSSLQICWEVL